jgi:hypothetical protein
LIILILLIEQVADQVDDRLRRPVDDRGHRFGQPDPLVDGRGLAAHDEHPVDGSLDPDAVRQLVEHRQDGPGLHAVGIEPGSLVRRAVQVVFEQGERAGRVPLADRVDEDERAVAVEQAVGQVHAADADVGDLDAVRQVPPGEPARDLDPEPVVGEEDVADPGNQDSSPGKYAVHGTTSISSGWK